MTGYFCTLIKKMNVNQAFRKVSAKMGRHCFLWGHEWYHITKIYFQNGQNFEIFVNKAIWKYQLYGTEVRTVVATVSNIVFVIMYSQDH